MQPLGLYFFEKIFEFLHFRGLIQTKLSISFSSLILSLTNFLTSSLIFIAYQSLISKQNG